MLQFDKTFTFKNGQALPIDGNTAEILKSSRFFKHFSFDKAPCCVQDSHVRVIIINATKKEKVSWFREELFFLFFYFARNSLDIFQTWEILLRTSKNKILELLGH